MFAQKRAQGISLHTIIVAVIGIIVLVIVILALKQKITSTKAQIDEKSDEFKQKCALPGSGRRCVSGGCASSGGFDLGTTWVDCKGGTPVCCQY